MAAHRIVGRHYWPTSADEPRFDSFSVACFKWDQSPTSLSGGRVGPCLVRIARLVRIVGHTTERERVYARAIEVCEQLDAGTYAGPSVVRLDADGA